ncbi:MAG: hypothetical protein KC586_15740, partial [Myxococcales bacterium]|nr:hypothetical protein [Myxococcales bacterium]
MTRTVLGLVGALTVASLSITSARAQAPVEVEVRGERTLGLDRTRLEAAARDQRAFRFVWHAAQARVRLRRHGDEARVLYRAPDGRESERRVALPEPLEERAEAVVWLVSNLVRDEAAELL